MAAQCGFNQTGSFTRAFGKHFGVSPTTYREHFSGHEKALEVINAG
ncbi:helix-turn-helix domain-containing protein [Hahella ganghwensis]